MKKNVIKLMSVLIIATSCVSKKKYVELENRYKDTKGNLQKTTIEKEALEAKFSKIEKRVDDYNEKINSLKSTNLTLKKENETKLDMVDGIVFSDNNKDKLLELLKNVDADKLANAKTLKDSINVAISYNLNKSMTDSEMSNDEDIDINIDKTVVMISVSDKLLFNTGSYRVKKDAYKLLEKLANVLKSEPSMDVMIEGHTDSRTIKNSILEDNWDLSVKRATSIVRLLENKYNIDGNRLIASGRGSSVPLVDNDTKENRAKNRRTRIVILPNLDKFFALLSTEE